MRSTHARGLLAAKIVSAIAVCLAIALGAGLVVSWEVQRERTAALAAAHARELAWTYFDGLNMLMLSGAMGRRDTLRSKLLRRPELTELRLVRGEAVTRQYGPGSAEEHPRDAVDRAALAGEEVLRVAEGPRGRVLTLALPVRAERDARGVDCLACHRAEEGTVLGAVRLAYSLAALDAGLRRDHELTAWTTLGIGLAGLAVAVLLLGRVVVRPLARLRACMGRAEREADLTARAPARGRDDLAATARSLNAMLEGFGRAVGRVRAAAASMEERARGFVTAAERTERDADAQDEATAQLASAVAQMAAAAQEIARHTGEAAEATREASAAADAARALAERTRTTIEALRAQVESSIRGMRAVEATSADIERILDIIRQLAEETGLLALNAAIEAARAGEQGRGFTVVAGEVRALANKTRSATEEIRELIERLCGSVAEAASTLRGAGEASMRGAGEVDENARLLRTVAEAADRVAGMTEHIASAAAQQSAVAEEMGRTVERIRERARRTADEARATRAGSEALAREAAEVAALAARFRT